ncbi:heme oxygenase [Xylographa trunciseda]|nr:heme oxygenase [Xylographa trunciseda]
MAEPTAASSTTVANSSIENTLPKQINSATKSSHTHLNRLILARLPLALPPHSQSPEAYATGLQRIAPIYLSFESLWGEIVDLQPLEASQAIDHRVFSALKHLYIPKMLRSQSLRSDISYLLHHSLEEVDDVLEHMEGLQLHLFLQHFEQTCAAKPHVLIAYAWVMYMALFNGGRWIRAQLLAAKESSWRLSSFDSTAESGEVDPGVGLAFWHFPGEEDGEDLKNEFKARLNDVEGLLDAEQRQDIVDEALSIFKYLALLVEELDDIVAAKPLPVPSTHPSTLWSRLLMKHFLPLGMVELVYAFLHWISTRHWYGSIMAIRRQSESADDDRKRR